jgi:hypothetical protein
MARALKVRVPEPAAGMMPGVACEHDDGAGREDLDALGGIELAKREPW